MRRDVVQLPIDASRMNVVAEQHSSIEFNQGDVGAVVAELVQVQRVANDARYIEDLRQCVIARCEIAMTLANCDLYVRLVDVGEAMRCR